MIGELFPRDIVRTPHGAIDRSPRDDRALEIPTRDQRAS
jgi:hypothetical protein